MNKRMNEKNKNLKIIKHSRKRKSKKLKLLVKRIFLLVSFCIIMAILFLGINLFLTKVFSVRSITVEGNTKYDNAEIIKNSEIKEGNSFVFTNTRGAEEKIYNSLPYVDGVKITKKLPDKIKIAVKTAIPQYVLYFNNEYLILSESDKLLEKCSESPPELINIVGVKFSVSKIGKIIYENETTKDMFLNIANTFRSNGLNNIKGIDVSDIDNIIVYYDNRLRIEIGKNENINYKILTAKEIIINKIGSSEKGTLNLTNLNNENRSYFTPEE